MSIEQKIYRNLLIIINDLLIIFLSLNLSYFIRIEYLIKFNQLFPILVIAFVIYILLFFFFNINNQYFRFFNTSSHKTYFKFFIFYQLFFGIFVFLQTKFYIPRSLIFIFPTLLFLFLILNRLIVAKFFEIKLKLIKPKTIIFGFNYDMAKYFISSFKIVYFIDDNVKNSKKFFNGINIISTKEYLRKLNKNIPNLILIHNEKVFDKIKNNIRDFILKRKILVQKIKSNQNQISTSPYFDFNYFFNRKNKINPIGKVYDDYNILITGAGGSIGSNIVLQLLKSNFKTLILLDNSEYNLYKLKNSIPPNKNIIYLLRNFEDKDALTHIFDNYQIDIIFHVAAYKHVPLIETNPFSAIKNNLFNSYELMKLVTKFEIPYFCLVSSDKAVRPTNIMGASKRLTELALNYFNDDRNNKTKFYTVRFGNVINSSGSVMPLFQSQIEQNLPITLTHREIIRYFMTIEEAANLVINTVKITKGGEIFLLDMGQPIKLLNLAKLMIQFSGKNEKKHSKDTKGVEIKVTGLRKGEKLYEELLVDNRSKKSSIPYIFESLENRISRNEFIKIYKELIDSFKNQDIKGLKNILKNPYIKYKNEI